MREYKYGKEVKFALKLLEYYDKEEVEKFSCGNKRLDDYIHQEIFCGNEVLNEDGLIFKVEDMENETIIALVSLAASGLIFTQTNYMKLLPAIKIDVFAVDVKYQKMHYDEESENANNPDDHYYLSDCIMAEVIKHCNQISEEKALVDYVLLYADKHARRFYDRNLFSEFKTYMKKENIMEINRNIPMYMKL